MPDSRHPARTPVCQTCGTPERSPATAAFFVAPRRRDSEGRDGTDQATQLPVQSRFPRADPRMSQHARQPAAGTRRRCARACFSARPEPSIHRAERAGHSATVPATVERATRIERVGMAGLGRAVGTTLRAPEAILNQQSCLPRFRWQSGYPRPLGGFALSGCGLCSGRPGCSPTPAGGRRCGRADRKGIRCGPVVASRAGRRTALGGDRVRCLRVTESPRSCTSCSS